MTENRQLAETAELHQDYSNMPYSPKKVIGILSYQSKMPRQVIIPFLNDSEKIIEPRLEVDYRRDIRRLHSLDELSDMWDRERELRTWDSAHWCNLNSRYVIGEMNARYNLKTYQIKVEDSPSLQSYLLLKIMFEETQLRLMEIDSSYRDIKKSSEKNVRFILENMGHLTAISPDIHKCLEETIKKYERMHAEILE